MVKNIEEQKEIELIINYIANNVTHLDIEVDSIEEAIIEVNRLKIEKGYDLFRGQSGLWPVISGLNRLDDENREQTLKKAFLIKQYISEFEKVNEQDKIIAVLQHYELPTNFIDFTTDPNVAAYFTTLISGREPNEYACIICIDTEEIKFFLDILYKEMKEKHLDGEKKLPNAEIIDICVDNLLRQKAQKGKFLFLPFIGFEIRLPFKRIVFKNSKDNVKKFNREDFYPKEKSKLEENIDTMVKLMKMFHIIDA